MFKNYIIAISSLIFVSCGGGGGGGGDPVAPSPPTPSYSIASGNIYTTSQPSSIYVDENMNGFKDSYEISASPSSNGSFDISITNQSKATCLKNFPISSDNPSIISVNNSQGNNLVINAFTSLYRSVLYDLSTTDPSLRENNNIDCSIMETYAQKATQRSMNTAIKRMEIFDNHTYAQIAADPSSPPSGSEITSQRSQDISTFVSSINSIKNQITTELNNILATNNSNVTMVSNGFLNNSALRVFLNKDTYPNPSTDLSPVAQSISSIALPAQINFLGTWNDYAGSYDNTLRIITYPFISSGGDIIQTNSDCYINFTSLCKVNSTFIGILNSSNPIIYDTLHKNTSRGSERWEQILDVYSDNNTCYRSERIGLTTTESNKITLYLFRDGWASGNFNPEDFECYIYDYSNIKEVYVYNYHEDGAYDYVRVSYDSFLGEPAAFQTLPNSGINYDQYSDTSPPPEQIPSEYINVFQEVGSNQMSSFLKLISNSSFYSGGGQGTQISFGIRTSEGRSGYVRAAFYGYNNVSVSCSPIDGEFTSAAITTNELSSTNIFDLCKTQLVNSYEATSSASDPTNISPFTGTQ